METRGKTLPLRRIQAAFVPSIARSDFSKTTGPLPNQRTSDASCEQDTDVPTEIVIGQEIVEV